MYTRTAAWLQTAVTVYQVDGPDANVKLEVDGSTTFLSATDLEIGIHAVKQRQQEAMLAKY